MTFGDTPIDLAEPQLIFSEAVEITGIPAKTLNNWTQREIINIGTMHRTGRRLYSIFDMVELAIVVELATMVSMPASQASAVAAWARKRGFERTKRAADGKLKPRSPRSFLIVWVEGDNYKIKHEVGFEWLTKFSLAHPFVVVPLDDVITRVENKAFDLLEREHLKQNEAGDER
jgi:hypothetical protein